MKQILTKALIVGASTACIQAAGAKTPERKPNVIIILTDDMGYGDLSCYGSPNIETKNIDRLASEGTLFTCFYAASFSAPSRSQLMTGCYPPRVSFARNPSPNSSYGLNPDEVTIAEMLKEQGYSTMCIGKWHLGDAPEFLPTRQGFDSYFGLPFSNDMWRYHPRMAPQENEDSLMKAIRKRAEYTGYAGQGSYYPEGGGFPNDLPLMRDEEVIEKNPDQCKLTIRYTDEAVKFIEKNSDKPFFLYLAHSKPHVPLFVADWFADKSLRGLYGDVVMEIDWSVGQIIECLKKLNIDRETLVVFMSDNGPWLQYGIDGGSAGPLRDGKGTSYEGGFRVPAIFAWPGSIPSGRIVNSVASGADILPTIAAITGSAQPGDRIIDGLNIWPLLSGKTGESPHKYFHYFAGSAEGKVNYTAIRGKRWKLFVRVNPDGSFSNVALYDINSDVSERFDRLEQFPAIAGKLNAEATKFYHEIKTEIRPAGHLKDYRGNGAETPGKNENKKR